MCGASVSCLPSVTPDMCMLSPAAVDHTSIWSVTGKKTISLSRLQVLKCQPVESLLVV